MSIGRKYRQFHGHAPRVRGSVWIDTPEGLVRLGRAVAIEYECDKLNGGGDGQKAVYRHEFKRGAYLYMDEKAARQLYIIGDRIKVTDAGIEN